MMQQPTHTALGARWAPYTPALVLINVPGLDPESDDDQSENPEPAVETIMPEQPSPDTDRQAPEEMVSAEIDAGVRERNRISNPDAGI